MSAVDAFAARTQKTGNSEYLWSSPDAGLAISRMLGIPTIVSPAMAAGTWLVGSFQQVTVLFLRESLAVEISCENEDDFVKNMATIRAEERAALAIPTPAGLLKGSA